MSTSSTSKTDFEDSPYRYLNILRNLYPDLYQHLNSVPATELTRKLEIERLRTNYMNDYCILPSYGDHFYSSLKQKDNKLNQYNSNKEKIKNIKNIVYQPSSNYSRSVSVDVSGCALRCKKFINEIRWFNTTEYRSNICKTGCIIRKSCIHDHSKFVPDAKLAEAMR
ncbi:uncharacterized protein LOC129610795 [Condylostylus longicornis]|uniref:uncharacterized protein LOC129610795 n=1 Tax=Condylostylus longicornis TaxID=2530218 RepID=UPI00244E05F7|nr:uncharacterized protein LOC129610795 [Condylostylus longicornis]